MKSGFFLTAFLTLVLNWTYADEADVWMAVDFDGTALVAGTLYPACWEYTDFCRSHTEKNRAMRFAAPRVNLLTWEQSLAGSTQIVQEPAYELEVPVTIRASHVKSQTGLTFSAVVTGEAGTTVRLRLETLPMEVAEREKITQKAGFKLPVVEDQPFTQEVRLTGHPLRVATYCFLDDRVPNRVAKITVENPDGKSLEISKLQLEQSHHYPHFHTAPTPFVPGNRNIPANPMVIRDPALLKSFPTERGTVAFRYRNYQDSNLPNTQHGFFSFKRGWHADGVYMSDSSAFTFSKRGLPFTLERNGEWNHLALVWNETESYVYQNGELIAKSPREKVEPGDALEKYTLTVGGIYPENTSAACEMDDFYIFTRDLTAAEIGQIARETGTLLGSRFYVSRLDRTVFFQNEMRKPGDWYGRGPKICVHYTTRDETWHGSTFFVSATVGGVRYEQITKDIEFWGDEDVEIPFRPSDLPVGTHAVKIECLADNGTIMFEKDAEITILPPIDRSAFKLMSWGGSGWTPIEYYQKIGINTMNLWWNDPAKIEEFTRAGMFINIRVENSKMLDETGYYYPDVKEKTRKRLSPYRNYYNWTMTLCNSEVYGSGQMQTLRNNVPWCESAQKEMDQYYRSADYHLSWDITHAPTEIPYFNTHPLPEEGIIDENDTLATVRWFMEAGMPAYRCNRHIAEIVHDFQKDNVVWSEPCMSSGMFGGLDMAADWAYAYDMPSFVRELKKGYARARTAGKKFMPTVTMGYWRPLVGKRDGADVSMAATVDELKIKSMLAITTVPAHSLSFFAVDAWASSEPQNFSEDSAEPPKYIVERNSGQIYGKFVREKLLPAAEMLRELPLNPKQTPIAVILPESSMYYCGLWWGHYHYTSAILNALGRTSYDYDILYDNDMHPHVLSQYKLVIFPAGKVVTRKNYELLRKFSEQKTIVLVVDRYCGQEYPNAIRLSDMEYEYGKFAEKVDAPLWRLLDEQKAYLSADLPLFAEGEAGPVRTSVRSDSVFTITNDARTTGEFNRYFTSETYRPYGVGQNVRVRVKAPYGKRLYDFYTGEEIPCTLEPEREIRLNATTTLITRQYSEFEIFLEPAETKIICAKAAR